MAAGPIIADSSIWIDHINDGDAALATELKRRRILVHPMVIGEIALWEKSGGRSGTWRRSPAP